jgi:hypothetical protein
MLADVVDKPRTRQVWTRDEWRLITRVVAFLQGKDVAVVLGCRERACQGEPLRLIQGPHGLVLRCKCTDRVIQ